MPSHKTIYLVRHADCRQDDIKRYIGQIDLPLNQAGVKQALGLARTLGDIPFTRVYCSDLKRSYDTARIISGDRCPLIDPMPELREIALGVWDGSPMEEIHQMYPQEYKERGIDLVNFRPPGGESFHDLAARIIPLFSKLLNISGEHFIIVGHAGVNRVILCHVLGMPIAHLFRLQQDYACINLVEVAHYGMRLLSMNTSCLKATVPPFSQD